MHPKKNNNVHTYNFIIIYSPLSKRVLTLTTKQASRFRRVAPNFKARFFFDRPVFADFIEGRKSRSGK